MKDLSEYLNNILANVYLGELDDGVGGAAYLSLCDDLDGVLADELWHNFAVDTAAELDTDIEIAAWEDDDEG